MNLLLDTHTFIWFVEDDNRLSHQARSVIENPKNAIYISIVSLWEIAIKLSIGKLSINNTIDSVINNIQINGFELLPILPEDIITVSNLEFHHRDPFDRIIAAQSLNSKYKLVSIDEIFDKYKVSRLWN